MTTDPLLEPMPYSPDCAVGKHAACVGGAWNFTADEPCDCACDCHKEDR